MEKSTLLDGLTLLNLLNKQPETLTHKPTQSLVTSLMKFGQVHTQPVPGGLSKGGTDMPAALIGISVVWGLGFEVQK